MINDDIFWHIWKYTEYNTLTELFKTEYRVQRKENLWEERCKLEFGVTTKIYTWHSTYAIHHRLLSIFDDYVQALIILPMQRKHFYSKEQYTGKVPILRQTMTWDKLNILLKSLINISLIQPTKTKIYFKRILRVLLPLFKGCVCYSYFPYPKEYTNLQPIIDHLSSKKQLKATTILKVLFSLKKPVVVEDLASWIYCNYSLFQEYIRDLHIYVHFLGTKIINNIESYDTHIYPTVSRLNLDTITKSDNKNHKPFDLQEAYKQTWEFVKYPP